MRLSFRFREFLYLTMIRAHSSQIQIQKMFAVHCTWYIVLHTFHDARCILDSFRCIFESAVTFICLCGRWSSLMLFVLLRWARYICTKNSDDFFFIFVCLFLLFRSFYRVLHIVMLSMNALRLAKNSQITYESAIYFLIQFFARTKSMHMRLAFLQL